MGGTEKKIWILINLFLASSDFCHLLITFANILDPYVDRQIQTV